MENDFNTYAETAFGAPGRLIAQAAASPVVARKAALLLQAYAQRDARMVQTYRKLGIDHLAVARPDAPADYLAGSRWTANLPMLSAMPGSRLASTITL